MSLMMVIGEDRRTFDMLGGKLSNAKDLFKALDGINSNNGSTAGQGGWVPVAAAWNKLHPSVIYDRDYEVVLGKLFDSISKSGNALLKRHAEHILTNKTARSSLPNFNGRDFSLGTAVYYGDGKCIYSILNTQAFKNILAAVGVDQKSITKFIERGKSVTPARLKNSIEAAKAIHSLLNAICAAPDSPDVGLFPMVEIKSEKDYEGLQLNTNIKYVRIADGVSHIERGAFNGCTALKEVIIPPSVRGISTRAFQNCTALKAISLPEGIQYIQWAAFLGCTSLKKIVIPSSVSELGDAGRIFEDCQHLEKVVIKSNRLRELPTETFKNCTNLRQITIPTSVERIGARAFLGCPQDMTILGNPRDEVKVAITRQLPNAQFNDNN